MCPDTVGAVVIWVLLGTWAFELGLPARVIARIAP
jgi:hypothetical protein